ncbi:MAG: TIGR00374 family protein [Alphaproteobacteria bacterium]|nr:TIGR00374 family protein [Alphaproteobacteria bacterium]|tara:strand:+ start:147 stop:1100 length:954 start_codon:yes stop_codon:yes gene_type:complete
MRAFFQSVLGLAFGGFFLWLALRMVGSDELLQAVSVVQLHWIGVALCIFAVDMALRVKRWQFLLSDTVKLSNGQVAKALIIGYMVNNLLPARLGEIYRADFVKRHYGGSRSSVLGTIVVERLLDGFAVVLSLSLGLLVLYVSRGIDSPVLTTLAIVAALGCTAAFGAVFWFHKLNWLFRQIPWSWLTSRLEDFSLALQALKMPGFHYPIILTGLIYMLEALVLWAALTAAGIDVGLAGVLIVLGTAVLSTLLPTAPGYVGSLQIAYIFALAPFGYEAPQAFIAATISQVFLAGSLIVTGLLIMFYMNVKRLAVRHVS